MTSRKLARNACVFALRSVGRADGVVSVEPLSGGLVCEVWRVLYADGSSVVAKMLEAAPSDLFSAEAEGLAALQAVGAIEVPEVLEVTERLLVLEALAPREDSERAWAAFAVDLVELHHRTTHTRFGWHRDNYLGRLQQTNGWNEDGYEFFAENRLLRYLQEPPVDDALDTHDRNAIHRLCERLPEVIPPMSAVLTHGDLWAANLLTGTRSSFAVIDPAISYGWAESDLANLYGSGLPDGAACFFDIYREKAPLADGWEDRRPIFFLPILLGTIAHFTTSNDISQWAIRQLRATLEPHYRHDRPLRR